MIPSGVVRLALESPCGERKTCKVRESLSIPGLISISLNANGANRISEISFAKGSLLNPEKLLAQSIPPSSCISPLGRSFSPPLNAFAAVGALFTGADGVYGGLLTAGFGAAAGVGVVAAVAVALKRRRRRDGDVEEEGDERIATLCLELAT